jgi:hypothetical protein
MFDFLGTFTLLNPWYLSGLAAAAIPLIIHLSRSRRTKKMRFSTTRFFTDQFLRSYRMSRLKELLLLACRMALFALLALALTQPLFLPKGTGRLGSGGSRSVVLVLDNSASMGYTEKGETLLDRARRAAHSVLQNLKSGDTASVVLASRRDEGPEVLFPRPTDQLNDVRQAVDRLEVQTLGTDLAGAVERAELLARNAPADSKEVYVFSDLQQSGWAAADEKNRATDEAQVSFVFVHVRPEQPVANRAVTAVQYAAARPMVGVPFAIRPLLAINGDDNRDTSVRLYVDGEKVGEQRLEKGTNGRWAMPRFHHAFATPGWHSGHVEVDDSNLPQDNHRHFALEVLGSVKVLAVNGAPSQVPRLDELFFLRLALTASPEGQKSPFEVDTVAASGLGAAELGKYPLVILANVESLPAAAVEKLEEYVDGGGSLLVFLGDKVNPAFYNETLAGDNRRHGGLLPGRLAAIEGSATGGKDIAFIGGADYDHPALAAFQDARSASLVGRSVTFKALWKAEVPPSSLLMKTDTGLPLLAEKGFGKGRVMLFTSTCDRDWTNFPIRPVFLPWTHRLVAYLAQQTLGHQAFHRTGEVVELPVTGVEAGAPLQVKKPNGAVGALTFAPGEPPSFLFMDTVQPGIYTLFTSDQKTPTGLFAVNLDAHESNLTYLDEAGLKDRFDRPLVSYVQGVDELSASGGARQGVKLWDVLLWLVLAIGVLEPWLANRISTRLYGKPQAAPTLAGPSTPGGRTVARPSPEPKSLEGSVR